MDDIAARFDFTPRAALTTEVAGRWRQVEMMLDSRLGIRDGRRATLLGGQLTYYLGRLAFADGHYRDARRFADLADRYAAEIGDAMLTGSLAALRSSIAFYTRRWNAAATIAARARPDAPSYLAARLAAYEARGHARLGRRGEAESALAGMHAAVEPTIAARPGSAPFGAGSAAMFAAVAASRLGDGAQVRHQAQAAIDLLDPRGYEERGHAYLCLARGQLLQQHPDPTAAVAAVAAAVTIPAGHLSSTILAAAESLVGELTLWSSDPDVRALGALVERARLAVPVSAS